MPPRSKRSLLAVVRKTGWLVLGLSAYFSLTFPCFAETTSPTAEESAKPKTTSAKNVSGDELVRLAWTDLGGLRGVLANGADPNARTRVGDYPIIRLAFGGNVEAVEILLDFNARTDVLNVPDGGSSRETLTSLTSFVAEREKMDLKNFSVMTAVINASAQVTDLQKIKMMQLLLAYGYPVDFYDGWGQTALMSCVLKNQPALARLLVSYGADSEAHNLHNGKTPRDYADTEEMYRILRGRRLYVPTKRPTYGKIDVRLVRPKRFPTLSRTTAPRKILQATRESALHLAVKDGDIENVRALIESGAQVVTYDLEKKTPLHVLCERQEIPFEAFREIYMLLERESGSKILTARDSKGRVPFHTLCRYGREDLAEFLLQRNPKQISMADSEQNTPLHLAATTGKNGREMIRFLVLNDAEVDRKNKAGETPLLLAVKNADAEAFYLIFAGVEIDPVSGISSFIGDPLFIQAYRQLSAQNGGDVNANLIEILRLLVENGTDVNLIHSGSGRNALHYAVAAGNLSAVSFLLDTNVDFNKVDLMGKTPLDIANESRSAGAGAAIHQLLTARDARTGKSGYDERRAEREKRAKMTPQERRAERLKKSL